MEGLYSQSQSYEEKKYFTRNLICYSYSHIVRMIVIKKSKWGLKESRVNSVYPITGKTQQFGNGKERSCKNRFYSL